MLVTLVMTLCNLAGCIEREQPVDGMQFCAALSEPAIAEFMHMEGLDVRGYHLSGWKCYIGNRPARA